MRLFTSKPARVRILWRGRHGAVSDQSAPARVRILSETREEKKRLYRDIFPRACRPAVVQERIGAYWILYEGTPRGKFDPEDYWVDACGRRHDMLPSKSVP